MTSVCLLDTSVFVEILALPKFSQNPTTYQDQLQSKLRDKEALVLPFATILETGNHIAKIKGVKNLRLSIAKDFANLVESSLVTHKPFRVRQWPSRELVSAWLSVFPEEANRGVGLADLSIKAEWKMLCDRYPQNYRVYVWSKDRHLLSCYRPAI